MSMRTALVSFAYACTDPRSASRAQVSYYNQSNARVNACSSQLFGPLHEFKAEGLLLLVCYRTLVWAKIGSTVTAALAAGTTALGSQNNPPEAAQREVSDADAPPTSARLLTRKHALERRRRYESRTRA